MQVYHYHNDHLGTPNELTDQQGEVVWYADYQAWGNTATVEWKEQRIDNIVVSEEHLQPIRFQGQSFDTETGLHYNRFRYFDPDMGMFTTREPIGLNGGINVFQYAPNPLEWIDPLGLMPLSNPVTQGHHMVPHAVATSMGIKPFNSQTGVPAIFFNDSQWTGIEHSAMHGYNGVGTDTKPKVKPSQVVGKMTPAEWMRSLKKHYRNPALRHIRGDLHLLTESGTKGRLLGRNVSPAKAWRLTKKWARRCT